MKKLFSSSRQNKLECLRLLRFDTLVLTPAYFVQLPKSFVTLIPGANFEQLFSSSMMLRQNKLECLRQKSFYMLVLTPAYFVQLHKIYVRLINCSNLEKKISSSMPLQQIKLECLTVCRVCRVFTPWHLPYFSSLQVA